jgi:hypothetical protein
MPLASGAGEPGVERIVDDEAVAELFGIVIEELRQAKRHGEQAGALGDQVEARGVGAANDRREVAKRSLTSPYFSRNASKLQLGPTCESSTPWTSNGIASSSAARASTSAGRTKMNSAADR